ncbi:MAG: DUF971 domain-containing protein [Burkholderiaceae bacterium]
MSGLKKNDPVPVNIVVHQVSRVLEVAFDDGRQFRLPFEFLRIQSPSAEVRGHGPGQETLQTGKRLVGLRGVDPVGNYAIQPHFDDGHSTGIFSWDYLYRLGVEQEALWADYLARLKAAGASRDPDGGAPAAPAAANPAADPAPPAGGLKARAVTRDRT